MKQKKLLLGLLLLLLLPALESCRQIDPTLPPEVTFDAAEYTVKTDRLLRITPTIKNDKEFAAYSWISDGKVIGREKELAFSAKSTGTYYVTFQVTTADGSARREVKINVVDLDLPIISINGGNDLIIETGEHLKLVPKIKNQEGLAVQWLDGDKVVSKDLEYSYSKDKEGVYFLTLEATNADGVDRYDLRITVVKSIPLDLSFSYQTQPATVGRPMRVIPYLPSKRNVTFKWFVNGVEDKTQTKDYYPMTATSTGQTELKVIATKSTNSSTEDNDGTRAETEGEHVAEATIIIQGVEANKYLRPTTATSSAYASQVFEFLAAPGQFTNAGYTANTMADACNYAKSRLDRGDYVSLGGFGGYLVVGFDHSIKNNTRGKGYDFAVEGNAFAGSSEPGIVWVMQDENGNGIPDDNWYELKGSEYGKPGTIQDYEVTYYRPSTKQSDVKWTDNRGNQGTVDWNSFHTQEYYPLWVRPDSYTLRGTRLNFVPINNGGMWKNPEFEWGYADNFSPIDMLTEADSPYADRGVNHFRLEDAIDYTGKPVQLDYIDFVKIQTGANAKAGWLGENSTEVLRVIDIQIPKN